MAAAESNCTVDELLRHADLAMYAAKREGGQCIRSFVPDLPLPYALPELANSTASAFKSGLEGDFDAGRIHRGAFGPVGNSANATALARTIKPLAAAAKPASEEPPDLAASVRWPPTGIRIALARVGNWRDRLCVVLPA